MSTESVIRPPKNESDAQSVSVRMSSIIYGHIAEFTSDKDVDLVIRSIRMGPYNMLSGENRFGIRAFHLYVVKNLTTTVKLSEWELDSPEIKYMSGIAVQGHISRRIDWKEEQIELLQNGGRKFQKKKIQSNI